MTRGSTAKGIVELLKLGRFGNRLREFVQRRTFSALFDLFTKSAGDYLDQWFESDLLKALHGFDSIVGNYASPYTPGTAYVLLHHAFGEVNGKRRAVGPRDRRHGRHHAGDGARGATSHGVEIETRAAVREVLIEKGRAQGVVLADGRIDPRACGRGECQAQAALYGHGAGGRARSGISSTACGIGAAAPARSA